MTATTLTYIAAQEHNADLRRAAERQRQAAEIRSPRRFRLPVPHFAGRRAARAATA